MEKSEMESIQISTTMNLFREEVGKNDPEYIAASQLHVSKSEEEKKLLRKSDAVVLPLAALCYLVAYLDRNSIRNARIMGFQKDLKMTSDQFYNCLTFFFVGQIAVMLPANIINGMLKPNRAIGIAAIFWGACLCGMSRAENYAAVMVLRVCLGAGQAFVTTLSIYTSLWYKRDEIATRVGIYYCCSTFSGAFGGLIAYGIEKNVAHATAFRPWGWLFLIEGLMAVAVGIATFFLLLRYPVDLQKRERKHRLLSRDEIDLAAERFATFNTHDEGFKPNQLWAMLMDPKSWLFGICQGRALLGVANVGSFLPTFINEFGYSRLHTQLVTIISYAFATVSVITCGILSDCWRTKAPFLLTFYGITCVGYIILLSTTNPVVGIVATVLVTTGAYVPVLLLPVWMLINTGGFSKRGASWALTELFGLTFSIMGTRIYNSPPRFIKGHSVVLSLNLVAKYCTVAVYWWMRRQNRLRDRVEQEYAARGEVHPHILQGLTLEDVQDYHISFRYML